MEVLQCLVNIPTTQRVLSCAFSYLVKSEMEGAIPSVTLAFSRDRHCTVLKLMLHLVLVPILFTGSYFAGKALAHFQYERSRKEYWSKSQMNTYGKSLFDL